MADIPGRGSLTVHVSAPTGLRWGGTVPVEVRSAKTLASTRGISGAPLDVPEGKYWVGTTLPDGREVSLDDLISVQAGESKEVDLKWSDLVLPDVLQQATWFKRTVADFVAPVTQYFKTVAASRVSGNWLAARLDLAPKPRRENISNQTVEIHFGDLPVILELSAKENPTYIAVPIDGEHGRTAVEWTPGEASGHPKLRFDFREADLNTYFDYVQKGLAEEARSISRILIDQAEQAVAQGKSPLRATLAAYVLLRANEIDGLDSWSSRLCTTFPWLPDAVAIRIEYLAREGRHAEASGLVPELVKRGAPWFRSGVAYVASRTKLYSSVLKRQAAERSDELQVSSEAAELMHRAAIELDEICGWLDVSEIISIYRDMPRLA